ncbi:hypothetical protein FOXYSP1_11533 [Fusarium oxysporum f. sp. phaseoli]
MRQRTAPCVKVLAMAASLNAQIFGRIVPRWLVTPRDNGKITRRWY